MVVGAVIAGVMAVSVFFLSKFFIFSDRERVSTSLLSAGATCVSTGGFLVGPETGFAVTGAMLILFGVLLGFENNGE